MPPLQLTTEVQYVKGIGPRTGLVLAEKGIRNVEDGYPPVKFGSHKD